MPHRKLDIAFWNYDRTRLLADRTVKIEGVDAAFRNARIVPEIFKAMIQDRAYDVSELGMTISCACSATVTRRFSRFRSSSSGVSATRLSTLTNRRASAGRTTSRASVSANWGSMATTPG
jgi:hypothetical protein